MPRIWRPDAKVPRLSLIKPVRVDLAPALDRERREHNARRGIETVLVLDTNVLRRMHDFAMQGGHPSILREYGLDQFLELVQHPASAPLVLLAGVALQELSGPLASQMERVFEWFCAGHLPGYHDHPLSLPPGLQMLAEDRGFWERPHDLQLAFALPYSMLLILQRVMLDDATNDEAAGRLERYVELVLAETDFVSAKEIEVARWCLSPEIPRDAAYAERRRQMIRNFVRPHKRRPRSLGEMRSTALNGAHDLWFVTSAAHQDAHGLQGVRQDVWIATFDEKLAEFCQHFHYIPTSPPLMPIASCTGVPTDEDPGYWRSTMEYLSRLQARRLGRPNRGRSADEVLGWVRRAETMLETAANQKLAPE